MNVVVMKFIMQNVLKSKGDNEMDVTTNTLDQLKNNVMIITFTKTNGDERIMRCTLQESYITEKGKGVRQPVDGVQAVWDIEKNAWRSFRWDSVKSSEIMA